MSSAAERPLWVSAIDDDEKALQMLTQVALRLPTNEQMPSRHAFAWLWSVVEERWGIPGDSASDEWTAAVGEDAVTRIDDELDREIAPQVPDPSRPAHRIADWMAGYLPALELGTSGRAADAALSGLREGRGAADPDRERDRLVGVLEDLKRRGQDRVARLALIAFAREARSQGLVMDPDAIERVLEAPHRVGELVTAERVPDNLLGYDDPEALAQVVLSRAGARLRAVTELPLDASAGDVAIWRASLVVDGSAGRVLGADPARSPDADDAVTENLPPGDGLDLETYAGWHRFLFGDVYTRAGEIPAVERDRVERELRRIAGDHRFTRGGSRDDLLAGLVDLWRNLDGVFEHGDDETKMILATRRMLHADKPCVPDRVDSAALEVASVRREDEARGAFDWVIEPDMEVIADLNAAERMDFLRSLPSPGTARDQIERELADAPDPGSDDFMRHLDTIERDRDIWLPVRQRVWIAEVAREHLLPSGEPSIGELLRGQLFLGGAAVRQFNIDHGPPSERLAALADRFDGIEQWAAFRPGVHRAALPHALVAVRDAVHDTGAFPVGENGVVAYLWEVCARRAGQPFPVPLQPRAVHHAVMVDEQRQDERPAQRALFGLAERMLPPEPPGPMVHFGWASSVGAHIGRDVLYGGPGTSRSPEGGAWRRRPEPGAGTVEGRDGS